MAETRSAPDLALPVETGAAGLPDVRPAPPAQIPAAPLLRPLTPGVATGLPVLDLPPLVEPVGFDDPVAEIRSPAANRRPIRRQFLAPATRPASDGRVEALPGRNVRPRSPEPAPLTLLREPAGSLVRGIEPEELPAFPPPRGAGARPAAERRQRWRPLQVGAAVTAALAVAAAFEIGVSTDWLSRLQAIGLHALPRSPATASRLAPPDNPAARVAYYTERAKADDAAAQLALAILYAKGEGVAQDYGQAANWFRRAAENGVMRAQYDLGVLYERGRGVPRDNAQAVSWYRKAAQQNHPLAQYNLAVMYTKGEGVPRDPFEAAVWYHRAAAQGVVAAMVNLAILYERGEGVEASTADAYGWYRAAARRGSVPASRRADELLQGFSTWDQTRAEAKMADIAASIHDAIGERGRLAAPASAPGEPGPTLKSGIEGERSSLPATPSQAADP